MRGTNANRKWIGPIFTGFGTLFTIVGLYLTFDAFRFAENARTTMGEVIHVEMKISTDSEGRRTRTYEPTMRYVAANGQSYTAKTHISSSGYDFQIGERMEILYDPADLTEVRLNSFWSLWMLPIAFMLGGLLFAVIGIFIWVNTVRGRAGLHDGTIRRDRDLL